MVLFPGFHNVSLATGISAGSKVKVSYKTHVIRMKEGDEDRIGEWQDALRVFDITTALKNQEDLDYLVAFFRAQLGPTHAFKLVDPLDFECTQSSGYLGVGDGIRTTYQLTKIYTSGLPGDTHFTVRLIQFPDNPIHLFANGAPYTLPYAIDYEGGIVTFSTPPGGVILTWEGTFQVPVRFTTTKMYTSLENYQRFESDIVLQEERLPVPANAFVVPESEPLDFEEVLFPPTFAEKSQIGTQFEIVVADSASGFEQRSPQFIEPKICFSVDQRFKTTEEMRVLLHFFHARRGKLVGFRARDLTDYQATDELFAYGDGTLQSFQLTKRYSAEGLFQVRNIWKPAGDIIVKVGETITPFSVDTTRGIVRQASGVSRGGVPLTWTGEFDIPVRFDTDSIEISIDAFGIYSWSRIDLVEIPITSVAITLDFTA